MTEADNPQLEVPGDEGRHIVSGVEARLCGFEVHQLIVEMGNALKVSIKGEKGQITL